MSERIPSFDASVRVTDESEPPSHFVYNPANARNHPDKYRKVRVVPWPDDAPIPAAVPQAGEIVQWRDGMCRYYVVNGIPKWDSYKNVWRLWVRSVSNDSSHHAATDELVVVVAPERTYTEAEIREAYDTEPAYTSANLIDQLRRNT